MIVGDNDLNRGSLDFRFDPPTQKESCLDIPKRLHFIWIGSTLPEKYAEFIHDFHVHNPDYEIHIWTDRACPMAQFVTPYVPHDTTMFDFINKDLIDEETNYGAKADLMRYEIVFCYGGIYLDVDTKSLGPDSLHEDMQWAFVQVSGEPWNNTTNSDFGFARHSEFLAYVIKNLRDPRVRAQKWDVPSRTGPTFFTTCIVSFGDDRFVHPRGWRGLNKIQHLGDGNWVNQQ